MWFVFDLQEPEQGRRGSPYPHKPTTSKSQVRTLQVHEPQMSPDSLQVLREEFQKYVHGILPNGFWLKIRFLILLLSCVGFVPAEKSQRSLFVPQDVYHFPFFYGVAKVSFELFLFVVGQYDPLLH